MNIVENKHGKFDIDTVEGAEKYLESDGVNVAEYLQKGIEELRLHNKILNSDEVNTRHKSKVLNIPRVSKSVCKHEWIMTADSFDQTCYCKKCGKSS